MRHSGIREEASRTDPPGLDAVDFESWFEVDFHPRFLLTRSGEMKHANAQGRALLAADRLQLTIDKRLTFGHPNIDAELGRTLTQTDPYPTHIVVCLRDGEDCAAKIQFLQPPHLVALSIYPTSMRTASEIMAPVGRRFGLTLAETSILAAIGDGQNPKEIARSQGLSIFTVRAHLRSIYTKMGVRSLTAAASAAVRLAR